MLWGLYSLVIAGVFSAITSLFLYQETERYKFLCLLCACFFFILSNIGLILQQVLTGSLALTILYWFVQWGSICCVALVLCSLLFFVRELKPKSIQFHVLYSLVPLLIILSFFLVYNSNALRTWLLMIYEAGAVAVGVILHARYYLRHNVFLTAFIGTMLFLVSFVLYFILPQAQALVWRLVLSISLVTVFSGYLIVNNYSRGEAVKSYKISL